MPIQIQIQMQTQTGCTVDVLISNWQKEILALFYDQIYHENANLEDIFKWQMLSQINCFSQMHNFTIPKRILKLRES